MTSPASQSGKAQTGLVSVVLPTYQRSDFLDRAISSVRAQSYEEWELIVVDDNDPASEHRTRTERYMQQYDDGRFVYLKHDSNKGGAAARNTGIQAARGEFVAFLDDDDEWSPEKLEKQVALLANAPQWVAMVYSGYRRVYTDSKQECVQLPREEQHDFASLLRANGIGTTSTILCRREALLEVGMFDSELPSRQDVDLYLRLARRYSIRYVPEPLVTWYRHDGEAIGKNRKGSIEAHRMFIRKYERDLERAPSAFNLRLRRLGILLLNEGRFEEARAAFVRAWRLKPVDLLSLGWWLVSNSPGHSLYRAAVELKGRSRTRTTRLHEAT